MTRWAAECDTLNSGPIWRIVKFVRQYAATRSTRSVRSSDHCRPGRPPAIASGGVLMVGRHAVNPG